MPENPPTDREAAVRLAARMVELLERNAQLTETLINLLQQRVPPPLPITEDHINKGLGLLQSLLMEEEPPPRRRGRSR